MFPRPYPSPQGGVETCEAPGSPPRRRDDEASGGGNGDRRAIRCIDDGACDLPGRCVDSGGDVTRHDRRSGGIDRLDRGRRIYVFLESPCNPHGSVLDVPAICRAAHEYGLTVISHATRRTPVPASGCAGAPASAAEWQKQSRHLQQRGFSGEHIRHALRDLPDDAVAPGKYP